VIELLTQGLIGGAESLLTQGLARRVTLLIPTIGNRRIFRVKLESRVYAVRRRS
jgi:hypothetical protein